MLDAVDFDPSSIPGRAAPAQPPAIPIELRVVSGPDRGKIHRIAQGASLVGRGLDCQIVLADPAVSRKHFKLERQGDEVVLADLGGANGTTVNGSKMQRKVLEAGDQIEIGTSSLEFFVDGMGAPRKVGRGGQGERSQEMRAVGGGASSSAKKGGATKIVAIVAGGLIVLGGGATAAYFLMKKGGDKTATAVAAAAAGTGAAADNPKLKTLISTAKSQISDADFSGAQDTLKQAKAIDPDSTEVKDLLKTARKEVENQETLDDAKQLVKDKKYEAALKKFAEIDDKSALHADAQDELNAAKETYVGSLLADAKKAQDGGDSAGAIKACDAVLKVDPKRAEAKALRDSLTGTADPKAADAKPADPKADSGKTGDAAVVKAPVAKENTNKDNGSRDKEPVAKPDAKAVVIDAGPTAKEGAAGSKKADYSAGLAAYKARQWAGAQQAFDAIAQGPYPKEAKAKALGYAAAAKDVGDAIGEGSASGVSPKKAVTAWKRAYAADKRVDGSQGSFLVGKIADAYLAIAKDAFAKKQFADASEAAGEALNYVPEKTEAQQIVDRCTAQAGAMLAEAKSHLEKKNYGAARDLARQVAHILPSNDPRSQQAQDIAKKANEAQNADND